MTTPTWHDEARWAAIDHDLASLKRTLAFSITLHLATLLAVTAVLLLLGWRS